MLPALLSTRQAFLIHDHHGHDVHCHPVTLAELDDWERTPQHRHHEHEHAGQRVDPPSSDDGPIVIVLDLPDFVSRVRALSGAAATCAKLASMTVAVGMLSNAATRRFDLPGRSSTFAQPARAGDAIRALLLSNHALLL
ncbi:MAG: hypothetical protein ACE5HE_03180 [Phycisphaerae bacterium]